MTENPNLRLLRLDVHDFKRVSAVQIDTGGRTVVLSGNNAAGKSSVIDALDDALRSAATPADPVRHGAEEARSEFTIGDDDGPQVVVKRTHYADGRRPGLEVRDANGNRLSPPRKVLDRMLGAFPDVMAFASPPGCKTDAAADKARRDMLLRIADVPLDLDALKARRAGLFADRTATNREAKAARAAAEQCETFDTDELVEEVSVADLVAEHSEATKRAATYDRGVERVEELRETVVPRSRAEVARIEAMLSEAREALSKSEEQLAAGEKWLAENSRPNVEEIADRLGAAEGLNDERRRQNAANQKHHELSAKAKRLEDEASDLTTAIERIDGEVRETLDAATMPGGLTVDADGVYLPGPSGEPVPFSSASTAQRIEASIAVAAASNPRLRTLVVRSANDLDPNTLARVLESAAAAGYQLLVERVAQDVEGCVVIEDGTAVAPAVAGEAA